MSSRRIILILGLGAAATFGSTQPQFSVQQILVNGQTEEARCLSPIGAVGGVRDNNGQQRLTYLWNNGQATLLSGFASAGETSPGFAGAMNAENSLVGAASDADRHIYRAAMWDAAGYHGLGSLGGNIASGYAINDTGWIIGDSSRAGFPGSHPFLYRNGEMQDLGSLGIPNATYGRARHINSSGLVAGYDMDVSGEITHWYGWYWTEGTGMVQLPFGLAEDLNDLGEMTSGSRIWKIDGSWTALPQARTLQYLNNNGWVIGKNTSLVNSLWIGQNRFDIDSLLPQGSGYSIDQFKDINDRGQILALATQNGNGYYVLLTPVPEPAGFVAMAAGLAAVLRMRVSRR